MKFYSLFLCEEKSIDKQLGKMYDVDIFARRLSDFVNWRRLNRAILVGVVFMMGVDDCRMAVRKRDNMGDDINRKILRILPLEYLILLRITSLSIVVTSFYISHHMASN